jgi:hypothetical protein
LLDSNSCLDKTVFENVFGKNVDISEHDLLDNKPRDISYYANTVLLSLELVASGMPMRKACQVTGTKLNTVSKYLNHSLEDGDFYDLKERANKSIIERASHQNYKTYTHEQRANIEEILINAGLVPTDI